MNWKPVKGMGKTEALIVIIINLTFPLNVNDKDRILILDLIWGTEADLDV